jgi:hypothetical protein
MLSHPPSAHRCKTAGCAGSPSSCRSAALQELSQLPRELRTRQKAGMCTAVSGWRRLGPSAELYIDPESGARCAVRGTGRAGVERYLWTVTVFGEYQVTAGRAEEIAAARSQAETALSTYILGQSRILGGMGKALSQIRDRGHGRGPGQQIETKIGRGHLRQRRFP